MRARYAPMVSFLVTLESFELAIKPDHDAAVLGHVQAWCAAKLEDGDVARAVAAANTPARAFRALGFTVDADKRGGLCGIFWEGNAPSWFEDLDPLWAGIDRHVEPGARIEITREDDEDGEGPDVIELGGDGAGDDDEAEADADADELDFER